MKIAELKTGSEYGAVESPTSSGYRRERPRRVALVSLDKVEISRYGHYDYGTKSTNINVTKPTVQFLDAPLKTSRSWDKIASAKKGAKLQIATRQIVGLWEDLSPGIKKDIEEQQARDTLQNDVSIRLRKVLGKRPENMRYVSVSTYKGHPEASYHLEGAELLKLLELAEAGKAAQA